jgi:hypothetical protein
MSALRRVGMCDAVSDFNLVGLAEGQMRAFGQSPSIPAVKVAFLGKYLGGEQRHSRTDIGSTREFGPARDSMIRLLSWRPQR